MSTALRRRERLVVCLDVGAEMASPWDAKKADGPSRFEVVVDGLKNWVVQKEMLSPGRQEYALVALGSNAELVFSWTTERDILIATLDSLSPRSDAGPVDLGSLVGVCDRDLGAGPRSTDDRTTTRILLVFGRSEAVPTLSRSFRTIDCFLDALYVHKKQHECENVCQDVYTFLTSLEARRPHGFFFETSSSQPRLQQSLALLLAHPLVRSDQDAMVTKLDQALPVSDAAPAPAPVASLTPPLPDPATFLPSLVARAEV